MDRTGQYRCFSVKALKVYFPSAFQVSTSFDNLNSARALVEEALGNSYGAARREAKARALVEWKDGLVRRLNK